MQNNSKVLDEIINSQKPHHDKSGLGYNQTENGSSSKIIEQEISKNLCRNNQRGYEDIQGRLQGHSSTEKIHRKWVYKNKLNEDGKITRNKARLVCKGYA